MRKDLLITSRHLNRDVQVSVITPEDYQPVASHSRLLILNDGQDFAALHIEHLLYELTSTGLLPPVLVVGIHANHDRKLEYGVAAQADYANRGDRAGQHTQFVLQELLPLLRTNYSIQLTPENSVIGGFSLGGLMALDIAWNHSDVFGKTGIFSGALWWRQKALNEGYSDSDRIMHHQINTTLRPQKMKFWFQTGTLDETDDRDGDGVIDSIADTLDCIACLERRGFKWREDIRYLEVRNGHHNPQTWAGVLPDFLKWAFPIPDRNS